MRSRQRIIDATLRVIEEGGFGAVNVAAVAETAQVSRQTVYSIFGSREELVSQTLTTLALGWLDEIRSAMAGQTEATDFVVELVVAGRALVRVHPVLLVLLSDGPDSPLFEPDMMTRAVPVVVELLSGLPDRDPRFARVLDEVAEIVTRFAVSVILFESDRISTDDGLRAFLYRWLVPSLTSSIE